MKAFFLNHPVWAITICTLVLFFLMVGTICGFIFYPMVTLIIFGAIVCLAMCLFLACSILTMIIMSYNENTNKKS